MHVRGLTLAQLGAGGRRPQALAVLVSLSGVVSPRHVPKELLTAVPLRDLALDAQYAEIRAALARYRESGDRDPGEGETQCRRCGEISGEDSPRCPCGNFLHLHKIFTCPGCAAVVAREARDCERCGAAFWSPVNPPEGAVTKAQVAAYLQGLDRAEFA